MLLAPPHLGQIEWENDGNPMELGLPNWLDHFRALTDELHQDLLIPWRRLHHDFRMDPRQLWRIHGKHGWLLWLWPCRELVKIIHVAISYNITVLKIENKFGESSVEMRPYGNPFRWSRKHDPKVPQHSSKGSYPKRVRSIPGRWMGYVNLCSWIINVVMRLPF